MTNYARREKIHNNIVFIYFLPVFKPVNNEDACRLQTIGECCLSYPYQLLINNSGLSTFKCSILLSAALSDYTVLRHSISAPTSENTDVQKLLPPGEIQINGQAGGCEGEQVQEI